MDKLTLNDSENKRTGIFGGLKSSFNRAISDRKRRRELLFYDVTVFLVAFLFSRTHLLFGAYPLTVAFLAVLPSFVWQALAGAVVGALTLGKAGIVYAMISVVVVFLRVVVSGTDKSEKGAGLFSEGLLLRMCSAVIGGFVAAVYEALLSGFSTATVMFGLSMLLLPPVVCFAVSGIFDAGIDFNTVFRSTKAVFSLSGVKDKEKYGLIFFQFSFLVLIFLVSLSLGEYSFLGVGAAYVFSSALSLITARRFGALRAMAIGFVSSVGISGVFSVSFALVGLVAGALMRLGTVYAVVGAGAALALFSGYTGGVGGFVTTFPEYAISASLVFFILGKIPSEDSEAKTEESEKISAEMVGTMALSYRNRYSGALDALESSFSSLGVVMKKYRNRERQGRLAEYSSLARRCAEEYLMEEGIFDFESDFTNIGELLASGGTVTEADVSTLIEDITKREALASAINRAGALYTEEQYRARVRGGVPLDFDLVARLISEARREDEREKSQDDELGERIKEVLLSFGLQDGAVRVLGKRKKRIILAGEDADGTKITSKSFLSAIEEVVGATLGTPEYFRRGNIALMECSCEPSFRAESATASASGARESTSGDVAKSFLNGDGRFYSVISDGMGSGEEAREVAEFVTDFLSRALEFGKSRKSVLKMLNLAMLAREGECSATVDLFSFDLYTGEAGFIKSGAAPSYLKRGSSIFRIRSRTAPIGLMRELDAERVKVETECDDYIVMLSDGISQSSEDSPWLIELLSHPPKKSLADYADHILSTALLHTEKENRDDMTVTVIKIGKR